MGSYYYLYNKKCPYCGKTMSETIFAENSYDKDGEYQGFDMSRCAHCKKEFRMDMDITFSKL